MTIQYEQTIITTRASFKLIVLGLLCGVLLDCITYIFISSSPKLFQLKEVDKNWVCFAIGFASSCACILPLKIVRLTNKQLIISRPFVFMKKVIPLDQIIGIKEQIYSIHTGEWSGGNKSVEYFGNKMKIQLSDNRSVIINSFEIGDYIKLCPLLMQSKGLYAELGIIKPRFLREYGWLISMFILAYVLVIVVFRYTIYQ